jgi:hypothetical protein
MSYELSDRMILQGELMKYRRSLCEQVSEYGGLCKKCRVSSNGQCAIGIVIKSLEHKSNANLTQI